MKGARKGEKKDNPSLLTQVNPCVESGASDLKLCIKTNDTFRFIYCRINAATARPETVDEAASPQGPQMSIFSEDFFE